MIESKWADAVKAHRAEILKILRENGAVQTPLEEEKERLEGLLMPEQTESDVAFVKTLRMLFFPEIDVKLRVDSTARFDYEKIIAVMNDIAREVRQVGAFVVRGEWLDRLLENIRVEELSGRDADTISKGLRRIGYENSLKVIEKDTVKRLHSRETGRVVIDIRRIDAGKNLKEMPSDKKFIVFVPTGEKTVEREFQRKGNGVNCFICEKRFDFFGHKGEYEGNCETRYRVAGRIENGQIKAKRKYVAIESLVLGPDCEKKEAVEWGGNLYLKKGVVIPKKKREIEIDGEI